MAIHQLEHQQQNPSSLLDSLYCEEERWEEEEEEEEEREKDSTNPSLLLPPPLLLLEQDLFWEDDELLSLFSKEHQTHLNLNFFDITEFPFLLVARGEAVDWIFEVKAHYGFTVLTAILAINYLDRFLFSLHVQKDKPWMIQLVAVACISLAAKVEENQVPLLLDLQVDTQYVFEAKTVQRMELLVLSTLQWRMNPVTPFSFVEHIARRLGLKTQLHWDFLGRCEDLLLSVVSDSRFVRYLPSVLATATMLHVILQVEPCNPIEYQNQLLDVLKIDKEKVNDCYKLIVDLSNTCSDSQNNPHKRKHQQIPDSPNGVSDPYFSSDSSNDSWVVGSSVSSSPEPLLKKNRAQEKQIHSDLLISLSTH